VRAALLEALAVGLGEDDKPFLDKLATDRAESVKQVAQRLLARMPTTAAFKQRLATAAQCFKRTGKGVGRVMAALGIGGEGTLTFAPPSGLTFAALDLLFSGMPLEALAEAVGVTPAKIIAALPEDEHHVRKLLLDSAVEEDNTATVQNIVAARLFTSQALTGVVIMPLATAARQPLDPDTAVHLLATPVWKFAVSSLATESPASKDDGRLIFTATLMPRAAIPAFMASLSAAPPMAARAAGDFADLILALPDRQQSASGASP
jgi:Family of unknown function (DUF5691)